jgi:TolB protein
MPVASPPPVLLTATGIALLASSLGAAPVVLRIEPFVGGTGSAVEKVVRRTLADTGDFTLADAPEAQVAFTLSAEGRGGSLKGTLRDAKGKTVFAQSYDALTLRDNARQLADECVGAIYGWPGISLTKIAFVSEATGRKEIYLCDADGTDIQQLTKDDSSCVSPSLRKDGQAMLFTSYVTGYPDIYLLDLETNLRKRVLQAPGTNTGAVFSPEGDSLALTMSFTGNSELYLVTPTGAGGRRLTKTEAAECSPSWSPEGDRLLYCTSMQGPPRLEIMSLQSGRTQRLETGFQYNTEPDWAPEGDRIAFTVKDDKGLKVAVMDFSTKAVTVIGPGQYPAWGADGRHLLFVRGNELVLRNVLVGKERILIDKMAKLSEPSWSR